MLGQNYETGDVIGLYNEDGTPICSAMLHEFSDSDMVLGRTYMAVSFPDIPAGTPIIIKGCNSRMENYEMRAVVASSSKTELELAHDNDSAMVGERVNFRFRVGNSASVAAGRYEYEVFVTDVSMSGACFRSVEQFEQEDGLMLTLNLGYRSEPVTLPFTVARCAMTEDGGFEYGVTFGELDLKTKRQFKDVIFELKRTHVLMAAQRERLREGF